LKPASHTSSDRPESPNQPLGLLALLVGSVCIIVLTVGFENVSQIVGSLLIGFLLAYLWVQNLALIQLVGLGGTIALLFLLKVENTQAIAIIWQVVGCTFLFLTLHLSLKSVKKEFKSIQTVTVASGELEIFLTSESIHRSTNLVLIVMAAFFWTTEGLAPGIKQIAVVAIAITGLANYGQWRLRFDPKFGNLLLSFDGLSSHSYLFRLSEFSFLEKITLEEGELSWLQLSGYRGDITLPQCLFSEPEVGQNTYEKLLSLTNLAKQEGVRDRLRLIGILLPLGAGTFGGICLVIGAIISIWLAPQEIPQKAEGLVLLTGVSLLSARLARSLLGWLAPKILSSLPNPYANQLQAWEVGAAIILIVLVWGSKYWGIGEISILTAEWLVLAVGIDLLVIVRRTPIISR
jgi:hypothetical protein